jgi:undecaprenyl-diphosphatase
MNILHTLILGIVEGVTEFLPISSTAHLDITRTLLGIPSTDFIKSFEIIIQLGAILAVVVLYFKKLFSNFVYIKNTAIAFIPTGTVGFVLYEIVKSFFLGNTFLELVMLILGGLAILIFEKFYSGKAGEKDDFTLLTPRELLIMGTTQALAVVPGVSRSLTVIASGRMLGLSKKLATEFSFFLAIPTMLAATVYDLYKSGFVFTGNDWSVLSVGFAVSFVVALVVVKWLLSYIQKHSFEVFGWYRIIVGSTLLVFLLQ